MTTISYSRAGAGEPLVLIHGIGHQRSAWGETFELLAQDFDVVAIDLPGFGRSPRPQPPQDYRVSSYLEQVEQLFADLDLGRPHVAGNSLGGLLALELAARGSVRTATAFAPAGFSNARESAIALAGLAMLKTASYAPAPVLRLFAGKAALRRLSLRPLYARPEAVPAQVAFEESLNLRRSPGFFPVARRLAGRRFVAEPVVPVTVAWGNRDRLLVPSQAATARRQLPMVRHVTLPGCGHVPMIDDPELVAGAVVQTIAEAAGAGRGELQPVSG